jgi:glycosyltransferase involved in cell wall biosynthesis
MVAHCAGLRGLEHRVDAFFPDTADEEFLSVAAACDRTSRWRAPTPPAREASLFGRIGPRAAVGALRLVRALTRIHREMAAAVDRGGYDVVLAGHDMYTHAPLALRHLRTPAAYYCQEPLRFVYDAPVGLAVGEPPGAVSRLTRRAATAAARAVLRPMDARLTRAARMVLANSLYSHESIMRAYGRPARVVYLGVDSARFRPLGLDRDRFVLSVGALHPAKGFDFVIEALGRIPASRRPSLVIVADRGYGGYRSRLEALARRAGVALSVESRLSDEELVRRYNQAVAVVYAPYLEPFGLVPLEAMSCGTPVVAVAEGGTRESITDESTGLLTARDSRAFAGAVERVLADAALARRLGEQGRAETSGRWTWAESARQLERALEDCAGGLT